MSSLISSNVNNWLHLLITQTSPISSSDVHNVCQLIQTNELTLEKVVIDLGPLITDSDINERLKGLNILSVIIKSLPKDLLSQNEIQHLIQFYCHRLQDSEPSIATIFSGLLALIECLNFDESLNQMVVNGLTKKMFESDRQYTESEKSLLFQILGQLFKNNSNDVVLNAMLTNEVNGQTLLPIILEAISEEKSNSNSSELSHLAALDVILQILVEGNQDILGPSLKSTVNNCINLSINSSYLKVRRSALNCLALIANNFNDSDLNSLRDEVIRRLKITLNDKKRLVRKSAVRARCQWIFVGQPGR
ncbi:uncharacterized protein LOC128964805 [Oppia nitens]|uniref:uncharacterized protein LOC128964805 n=1 Tax=Oppia nitens TaxID=1686743 RepID=UPI0023DC466C|nr:uncharacterized protein LOC128964805 [Oppia nitens]